MTKAEYNRVETLNSRTFVKNKIKKIMIPWYLMIIIYLVITLIASSTYKNFAYMSNTNIVAILVNVFFLNGFFPFANNNVVLGGWYIGSLVVIWAVFPYIYRIWKRYQKRALILLIIICISSIFLIGLFWGREMVQRNTFIYFSVINQLPCILYGMLFFENEISEKKDNYSFIWYVIVSAIVIVMFEFRIPFTACIYPVLVCFIVGGI